MKRSLLWMLTLLLLLAPSLSLCVAAETPSPKLAAQAAMVIHAETGAAVYEKNADLEMNASVSARLMTAYLAYQALKNRTEETLTIQAAQLASHKNTRSFYTTEWKSLWDYDGKTVTVDALFSLLLIAGAPDAADCLTLLVAESTQAFVAQMNETAEALGMTATHYTDTHGTASGAYTTASDLMKLAQHCLPCSYLSELASLSDKRITVGEDSFRIYNRNPQRSAYYQKGYLRDASQPLLYGGTEGNRVLVAAEEVSGMTYLFVYLGGGSRNVDGTAKNILSDHAETANALTDAYEMVPVFQKTMLFGEVEVKLSRQADYVTCMPAEELQVLLPKSKENVTAFSYVTEYHVPFLEAPVRAGMAVGTVRALDAAGNLVAETELVTSNALPLSTLLRFFDFMTRVLTHPLAWASYVLALLAALLYVLYKATRMHD